MTAILFDESGRTAPTADNDEGSMKRILVVDDEPDMSDVIRDELSRRGMKVMTRPRADEAFALLADEPFDVVVTDLNMRGMNGLELCHRVVANRPDIPVIVLTAFGSMETAIATLRAGAFDFLTKPFNMEELALSVERALQHRELRQEIRRLRDATAASKQFEELLGSSPAMAEVYRVIDRIADSDTTVLITGETGTGKELAASAIHKRSPRAEGPLITINCAAVPEKLLEGELFGHVRGAYTDARETRKGLLLEAHGGTLFLDEVGDMPLSMQAKLLRVLEVRKVRPLGGSTELPFDVRLIVATNRDLATLVEEGTFREDLYYRVNVIHIVMPPLRARGTDILWLAQSFVERTGRPVKRIAPAVAERLLTYTWPGNVRELRNCIERAAALAQHEELIVEDLPEHIRNYAESHVLLASHDPTELVPLAEVEKRYILRVLEAVAGNKREAARILGLDRATLYRKLERYMPGKKD